MVEIPCTKDSSATGVAKASEELDNLVEMICSSTFSREKSQSLEPCTEAPPAAAPQLPAHLFAKNQAGRNVVSLGNASHSCRGIILGSPRSSTREQTKLLSGFLISGAPKADNPDGFGLRMEGATVAEVLNGSLAAEWAYLKPDDMLITIGGQPFEASRGLRDYLVEGKRAYRVEYQRTATRSRLSASARLLTQLVLPAPFEIRTEEQMEKWLAGIRLS